MSTDQTPTQPRTSPGTAAVPDLTSYRELHDALRVSTNLLVAALADEPTRIHARTRALHRWFEGFSGELQAHHLTEDTVFFPALAERVPSYDEYAQRLVVDHDRLDELIGDVRESLARLATGGEDRSEATAHALATAVELRDLLAVHLDFEDADVLPLFERHFEVDEYVALDKRALASVTIGQALFTVPWFMATATPAAAARTLAEAPPALKIVHRLTRRRYARLVRNAFGVLAIGGRS